MRFRVAHARVLSGNMGFQLRQGFSRDSRERDSMSFSFGMGFVWVLFRDGKGREIHDWFGFVIGSVTGW